MLKCKRVHQHNWVKLEFGILLDIRSVVISSAIHSLSEANASYFCELLK